MANQQSPKNQGEGDKEADRRYRKRTDEFLENNDVDEAARRAVPTDAEEAEDMAAAEAEAKARAKGEDPAIRRRDTAPNNEPSTRSKTNRH